MTTPESGAQDPSASIPADVERISSRRILGLVVPALGVLAAEPLYLLYDAAIVERTGELSLAGLAVGGLIAAQVSTQLTFLTYGTTARAARWHGAGRRRDAVIEGVQATWLAVVIGLLLVGLIQVIADPVTRVLGGAEIGPPAAEWLRVAAFGIPMILLSLAGNGWMRGVQSVRAPMVFVVVGFSVSAVLCPMLVHGWGGAPELGLVGSAYANVIGQTLTALMFVVALLRERVSLRPAPTIIRAQLTMGRDLILRTLAFQACFLSATAVASRFGAASVGAHQLVLHIWTLTALLLDSVAVAAQTLVGAALGAGDRRAARALAGRLTRWSVVFAIVMAGLYLLGRDPILGLLASNGDVREQMASVWWLFVVIVPVAGVVFALDGVLLGAGDAKYLRTATLLSAIVGFLPIIWLSAIFGWGLPGIWTGLVMFVLIRAITVVTRVRGGHWLRVGTPGASTDDIAVDRPRVAAPAEAATVDSATAEAPTDTVRRAAEDRREDERA